MPRRNRNAVKGGNNHRKGGGGWMHGQSAGEKTGDRAPLTPGAMHSKTRLQRRR